MTKFVRYNMDEWSVLYQDGKMVVCGDSYLSDEHLSIFLQVEERYNKDCFLGGEATYSNVAKTLDEVDEYSTQKEASKHRAQELREKAKELLEEAKILEDL